MLVLKVFLLINLGLLSFAHEENDVPRYFSDLYRLKKRQDDQGYFGECRVVNVWKGHEGHVNVLAFLDPSWHYSYRQMLLLRLLKRRLENASFRDIWFFAVVASPDYPEENTENDVEIEAWREISSHDSENSLSPGRINVDELVGYRESDIIFIQDTPELGIWESFRASRDQIIVIDRCGKVTYQVIVPWSILYFPYVKAAILSTYKDNPCGPCNAVKTEYKVVEPTESNENLNYSTTYEIPNSTERTTESDTFTNNINNNSTYNIFTESTVQVDVTPSYSNTNDSSTHYFTNSAETTAEYATTLQYSTTNRETYNFTSTDDSTIYDIPDTTTELTVESETISNSLSPNISVTYNFENITETTAKFEYLPTTSDTPTTELTTETETISTYFNFDQTSSQPLDPSTVSFMETVDDGRLLMVENSTINNVNKNEGSGTTSVPLSDQEVTQISTGITESIPTENYNEIQDQMSLNETADANDNLRYISRIRDANLNGSQKDDVSETYNAENSLDYDQQIDTETNEIQVRSNNDILPIKIIMYAPHMHEENGLWKKYTTLVLETGNTDYHDHRDSGMNVPSSYLEIYKDDGIINKKMSGTVDEKDEVGNLPTYVHNHNESPGLYGEVADYWRNYDDNDYNDNNQSVDSNTDQEYITTTNKENHYAFASGIDVMKSGDGNLGDSVTEIEVDNYNKDTVADKIPLEGIEIESVTETMDKEEEIRFKLIEHYKKLLPWINYVLNK